MMCHGEIKRTAHGRGTGAQSYAVYRYQRGERPSKICKSLGRSRAKACESGSGAATISRKAVTMSGSGMNPEHRNVRRRTDSVVEPLVINVRKSLME